MLQKSDCYRSATVPGMERYDLPERNSYLMPADRQSDIQLASHCRSDVFTISLGSAGQPPI
jgi:hypothetical protein